jgi:hypothetical protein
MTNLETLTNLELSIVIQRQQFIQRKEPNTYTARWENADDMLEGLFAECDRRQKAGIDTSNIKTLDD